MEVLTPGISAKLFGICRAARNIGFFSCSSRMMSRNVFTVGGVVAAGEVANAANEFALDDVVGAGMGPGLNVRFGVANPLSLLDDDSASLIDSASRAC